MPLYPCCDDPEISGSRNVRAARPRYLSKSDCVAVRDSPRKIRDPA